MVLDRAIVAAIASIITPQFQGIQWHREHQPRSISTALADLCCVALGAENDPRA
jgi:hypothetical protein